MISGIIVLKKDNSDTYRYVYRNKESKDLLLLFAYLLSSYYGYAILNFLKKAKAGDSLGPLPDEHYLIELKEENRVSIIYLDYIDGKELEEEIVKMEKTKLMKILNKWKEIEERQPSEIIVIQNDNDIEIEGVFPLGECPLIPFVLYRKLDKFYISISGAVNGDTFNFIHLISNQFSNDVNIFINLINFFKDNNLKEFSCTIFKINIYEEKIIFTDTRQSNPNYFFPTKPNKEYELNKNHFINLIIDFDNAIKTDAQEIIISLKDDNSYKVEASYEPLEEEFPRYRCYP